jgi:hypothetical protein
MDGTRPTEPAAAHLHLPEVAKETEASSYASSTSSAHAAPEVPQEPVNHTLTKTTTSATGGYDESIPFNPDRNFYIAFLTLSLITLTAALDATSLSVALPIISQKLGGTAIEAFWAGTSFLLTSTVFQPNFASFSHIFGRKPVLMLALVFFTVGAILAAVSNNFTLLLVGRSLQGIGGGGIIVVTEIVVTDLVPLRLRGQWFGFISGMWAIGSVSKCPGGYKSQSWGSLGLDID